MGIKEIINDKVEKMAQEHAHMKEQKLHEKFMKAAIKQAQKAEALKEVPIGCVIVMDQKIIARGYNRRNTDKMVLAHAEISAIKKACKKAGDWRLEDCTMYITLEPCPMCAGAIVQARIPRVVIGSYNPKAGCAGSVLNILQESRFNHQVEIVDNVLQEECSTMLTSFFKKLRKEKQEKKAAENRE
ncbi:MAG: tRNA adenosine(34) deaminase TadA [Lachnospiraceae bacterium]|nr:tRNA adenosine(34) deaminase TadA [Lachnospiraceae bacterium]